MCTDYMKAPASCFGGEKRAAFAVRWEPLSAGIASHTEDQHVERQLQTHIGRHKKEAPQKSYDRGHQCTTRKVLHTI